MRFLFCIPLLLSIVLSACVAPQTTEEYVAKVRVKDSEFDSAITYVGPPISTDSHGFPSISGYARLRSFRVKATGQLIHQFVEKRRPHIAGLVQTVAG